MRTTITLDDDMAARLARLRKDRPFEDLVNEALRVGLDEMERALGLLPARYRVRSVKGRPRRTDLDHVADVIADVEGEHYW